MPALPTKGTKPYYEDLRNFLNVALDLTTGQLKGGSTVAVNWKDSGYTNVTQSDSSTFVVGTPDTGDLTNVLSPGRGVCFNADGTPVYAVIKSSSHGGSSTTVVVFTTNVPATITQLDIGIVQVGDVGCVVPVEPVATVPTYAAKYAMRLLYAIDTESLWFGDPGAGSFVTIGGNMFTKDWSNSAAKGGTAVTVASGATVTTKLTFGSGQRAAGVLRSLVVAGTSRAAITSEDFDVRVFQKSGNDLDQCVFEAYGISGKHRPYGLINNQLAVSVRNEEASSDINCLWVEVTNNGSASCDFDIEAALEMQQEG